MTSKPNRISSQLRTRKHLALRDMSDIPVRDIANLAFCLILGPEKSMPVNWAIENCFAKRLSNQHVPHANDNTRDVDKLFWEIKAKQ